MENLTDEQIIGLLESVRINLGAAIDALGTANTKTKQAEVALERRLKQNGEEEFINPFKEVSYFTIGYKEFDELVKHIFKRDFSVVADQELCNDMVWTYDNVNGEMHKYEINEVTEFMEGGHATFIAGLLLDFMCHAGLLSKGNYMIEVFW